MFTLVPAFGGHLPPGFGLETLSTLILVSVIVIPAVAILDLLLGRQTAAARHLAWLLAVIAVLATPILSRFMPDWNLRSSTSIAAPESPSAAEAGSSPATGTAAQQEALAPVPLPVPATASPTVEKRGVSSRFKPDNLVRFESIAVMVWAVGAVVVLGFGLAGQFSLLRMRRASREIRDPELLQLRDRVSLRLGLGRDVLLLENDRATMPMTWGVWRPILLLPAPAHAWPDDRLRMVLYHELMHVRRWDCLWQWMTLIAVAAHWFNPLIWFAACRLRTERERACDDGVLAAGHVASDYAELLLDLSTGGRRNVFAMCTGFAMTRSDRLRGRLHAIVESGRIRAPLSRRSIAGSVFAMAILLVPLSVTARMNLDVESEETSAHEDATVPPTEPQQQQRQIERAAGDAATTSGEVDVRELVAQLLPDHRLRFDGQGTPVALVSPDSEELKLPAAPDVGIAETGYWTNPAMAFLSEAGPRVSGSVETAQLIQLLHALCHGEHFVRQKIYKPRAIESGWLVEVDHDFENFMGMIPFIHPYEILVDDNRVTSLRQRSNIYPGSAKVYVDTITTVYEREVQVNGGINYPEVLEEELKSAWAREQGVRLRHNSLVYYPNAVISVTDEVTGERFYVESNGARLFFLNSDGATVHIVDVVRATDLENLVGSPVVRHLELRNDVVVAIVGKHTCVTVNRESGEILSVIAD